MIDSCCHNSEVTGECPNRNSRMWLKTDDSRVNRQMYGYQLFKLYHSPQELFLFINFRRPYLCDLCGASFSSKLVLQRHNITHNGVRSFKCALCPKTYAWPTALAQHMEMHNSGKKLWHDKTSARVIMTENYVDSFSNDTFHYDNWDLNEGLYIS